MATTQAQKTIKTERSIKKMKIAMLFFSYKNDEQLLAQALRAVPRLRELNPNDTIDIYVRDDATAPMSKAPDGVDYKQTTFNRCGNLNGLDCVEGMAGEYSAIIEAGGYDWLVKLDCDTYLNSLDWLRDNDPERTTHVGTVTISNYAAGACYAVSRLGAQQLQQHLQNEITRKRISIAYCEDKVISRLLNMQFQARLQYNLKNEIAANMLYLDWLSAEEMELSERLKPYAVTFKKCRWHTTPDTYTADIDDGLRKITAYADYADQHKQEETS